MGYKNTATEYGSINKFFHWFIALTVILMLLIGTSLGFLGSGMMRMTFMQIHKSLGLTILLVMFCRLCWRLYNPPPKPLPTVAKWQVISARIIHFLLYLTVILIPLDGLILSTAAGRITYFWWTFGVTMPGVPKSTMIKNLALDIHVTLAWSITVLLVLHIGAALKHHLIDKDDTLNRMS